ncbi:unnamed protein product [Linum tenue]|uniref:Secreted protein n=1 Tax=Linum tenue TaxID=586396 RepID=A0AAV0R0M3_9ROSI|nr:unnamed protein product [Linum tenue]
MVARAVAVLWQLASTIVQPRRDTARPPLCLYRCSFLTRLSLRHILLGHRCISMSHVRQRKGIKGNKRKKGVPILHLKPFYLNEQSTDSPLPFLPQGGRLG